ncbi:hypothetical protein FWH09_01790 [Candidatus Saccharibacteria bacterium]|nr:hypothetical protein [Candidatus Saccharibacteria bacterium]
MNLKYWSKQGKDPLFPDVLWSKPEQRGQAGNLGIIGGNKLGFYGVSRAVEGAKSAGVGNVRVLMPNALEGALGGQRGDSLKVGTARPSDIIFAPSTEIGSFSSKALMEATALSDWSDLLLIVGDLSKNSETAIFLEKLLEHQIEKPILLTRDAAELALPSASTWLHNPHMTIFTPLSGLQKLFRGVYYPKVITFSMPILTLIEDLHKFTLTYPVSIITIHQQVNQEPQFLIGSSGKVVTMPIGLAKQSIISPWLGDLSARISAYLMWNPNKPLEAITTALLPI